LLPPLIVQQPELDAALEIVDGVAARWFN